MSSFKSDFCVLNLLMCYHQRQQYGNIKQGGMHDRCCCVGVTLCTYFSKHKTSAMSER